MIDFSKPLRTRDGKEVRIYATDHGGTYPIVGAYKDEGTWVLATWMANGHRFRSVPGHPFDLVNIPRKFRTVAYVNVDEKNNVSIYRARMDADANAQYDSRIACVKVMIEGQEGDGL